MSVQIRIHFIQDFSESDMGEDAKKVDSEDEDAEDLPQASEEEDNLDEEIEQRRLEREQEQAERRRIRALKSKYKGESSIEAFILTYSTECFSLSNTPIFLTTPLIRKCSKSGSPICSVDCCLI